VGEIDRDGFLKITGRVKELFKTSKGKYVAPAPIEKRLARHVKIEASCVAGLGFPQPFAIVMLSDGEWIGTQQSQLRKELTDSLDAHLHAVNAELEAHERVDFIAVVPDQWNVDNGMITPTLKIKRASIEQRYQPSFELWARQAAPVVWHDTP
jgi:long-chain acyl-CoA synthetase